MRPRLALCLVSIALGTAAADCLAIEMWTFYGDGSRIGLPSLEVPVEAYPGIPLRSDRIRARRRAARPAQPAAGRAAGTALSGSVTVRPVPGTGTAARPAAAKPRVPVAPGPEDLDVPAR